MHKVYCSLPVCTILSCNPILLVAIVHIMYGSTGVNLIGAKLVKLACLHLPTAMHKKE